jgi:hypothetical protein
MEFIDVIFGKDFAVNVGWLKSQRKNVVHVENSRSTLVVLSVLYAVVKISF